MSSVKSLKYTKTTGAAAAKTLADLYGADVPANCDHVVIQCETQACRWRDDGTAPTAAIGQPLNTGDMLTVVRSQFANWQIFEQAATTVVHATFYKTG